MRVSTRVTGPAIAPRAITDDEVAFYAENGWVKLEGLTRPSWHTSYSRAPGS
jgi:hypothetical protein